jgi:hypothetical protein
MADFGQAGFESPVEQAVGVLRRDDARQAEFLGQPGELHDAPRVFVGNADVADLAFADQFAECFQLLADRRALPVVGRIELPLAEHRLVALRPVQLVEVDVVRLQALQRTLDGGADVGAVHGWRAVANPVQVAARAGDLGGEHDLVALPVASASARRCFPMRRRFPARRHGIHLGGVEEVDPLRQRVDRAGRGHRIRGLLAEGHGAEADLGNDEIAAAEWTYGECRHDQSPVDARKSGLPQRTP